MVGGLVWEECFPVLDEKKNKLENEIAGIGALEQGTKPPNTHSTCVGEPPHSLPACVFICSYALQG